MPTPRTPQIENLAKLACVSCAVVWGLFWIPLRALDNAGIQAGWATVVFAVIPLIVLSPLLVVRWRYLFASGWSLQITGIFMGICFMFYANAFFYTDVIRVLLLFYMTMVWGTLLARLWLKEPITVSRVVSILLGFSGMFVILSVEPGIPLPANPGDWMALISGLAWAFAAVLMKKEEKTNAWDLSVCYFLWASIIALAIMVLPFFGQASAPEWPAVFSVLPWFVPVVLLLLIPSTLALTWGAPLLSPGVTGVLFLTEISVATIAAEILTDEPFGIREITGVVLISLAGTAEFIASMFRPQRK